MMAIEILHSTSITPNESELVLVGAGGHCLSVLEILRGGGYKIKTLLDIREKTGVVCGCYEITGTQEEVPNLISENTRFLVTIGQIKDPIPRINAYLNLLKVGAVIATIVAPTACLAKSAEIGLGTILMHGSFVNNAAKIGVNGIINTGAIIEHGSHIGDHCHISTRATVNGDCRIGNRVFIGSTAVTIQGIKIADDVVIGAGAVVTKDIIHPGVYVGNPAFKLHEP